MVSFSFIVLIATAATASAQSPNTPIRYMPLGDSITQISCWRAKLWEKLQSTKWGVNVNLVGSGQASNNCSGSQYDSDNEGHSGFLAVDIANKKLLDGWLKTNPAYIVNMHLGTNDILHQNKPTGDILAAFTELFAIMRASNSRMKIIVAQIIPLTVDDHNAPVQGLNRAIVPWARGLNKTDSPILVVDQFTGLTSGDLRDGIHPNDSGDTKMANRWFPALVRTFEQMGRAMADLDTQEMVNLNKLDPSGILGLLK